MDKLLFKANPEVWDHVTVTTGRIVEPVTAQKVAQNT